MKQKLNKLLSVTKVFTLGLICGIVIATIHYAYKPVVISNEQIVDALAMSLDGDYETGELYEQHNVPIPQRKPEFGYTTAFINDMNTFIEGFQ